MRLFIGIPLSDAVVGELTALTLRIKSPSDGLRWSTPAGWHITLQFLGATTPEQYRCVTSQLRQISAPRFEIQLDRPGFFERSGIFFAGVHLSPELTGLQQKVVAATQPCGFVPEDRPYHPHITLARDKKGGKDLRRLKRSLQTDAGFSSFVATEFRLYESFPGPGGSRYEVREVFALRSKNQIF